VKILTLNQRKGLVDFSTLAKVQIALTVATPVNEHADSAEKEKEVVFEL
jgi:hypothetical protein